MTDEIEQLLRNLHLKKIAAIVDDELAHADKQELSYSAFLARLPISDHALRTLFARWVVGREQKWSTTGER